MWFTPRHITYNTKEPERTGRFSKYLWNWPWKPKNQNYVKWTSILKLFKMLTNKFLWQQVMKPEQLWGEFYKIRFTIHFVFIYPHPNLLITLLWPDAVFKRLLTSRNVFSTVWAHSWLSDDKAVLTSSKNSKKEDKNKKHVLYLLFLNSDDSYDLFRPIYDLFQYTTYTD